MPTKKQLKKKLISLDRKISQVENQMPPFNWNSDTEKRIKRAKKKIEKLDEQRKTVRVALKNYERPTKD